MKILVATVSIPVAIALLATAAHGQITSTGGYRPYSEPRTSVETDTAESGRSRSPSSENSSGTEALTVEEIIALTEVELGDEAIIAKIRRSNASFDLTTSQMIDLRERGVSGPVIAEMVRSGAADTAVELSMDSPDPNVPHPAGVYLLQRSGDEARMFRIDATGSSQVRTGGFLGYALTGGIASMSMRVSIPGGQARARASSNPVFYFFFDQAQESAGTGNFLGNTYLASSPADFNLVELDEEGDRREARVGRVNLGGARFGIMDEDRIPIDYELVRAGVYRVTVNRPLESGEYGFLYSVGSAQGGAATARIFDFSVR